MSLSNTKITGVHYDPASLIEKIIDKNILDGELVNSSITIIRLKKAYYLEMLQAMMDGAVLGAEQVQDKRLELHEKGEIATKEQFIATLLLTLVLEGTAGPALASIATIGFIKPLMKTISRAFASKGLKDSMTQKAKLKALWDNARARNAAAKDFNLLKIARSLRTEADKLAKEKLKREVNEWVPFRDALNSASAYASENLVGLTKAIFAVSSLKTNPNAGLDLSPGVNIVSSVMNSISQLRLMTISTFEILELGIKDGVFTIDEINNIIVELQPEGGTPSDIRSSFMLTTELAIWAKLIVDEGLKDGVASANKPNFVNVPWGDRGIGIKASPFNLIEQKPNLIAYLLLKFGKNVENWVLENDLRTFSESIRSSNPNFVRPTGFWEGLQEADKIDLLVQYLVYIDGQIPKESLQMTISN